MSDLGGPILLVLFVGFLMLTALFFHFIPRGTAELVRPRNWARLFGIPELDQVA